MSAKTVALTIGFGERFKPSEIIDIGVLNAKAICFVNDFAATFFTVVIHFVTFFLYLLVTL
jgi:hypothetical protein